MASGGKSVAGAGNMPKAFTSCGRRSRAKKSAVSQSKRSLTRKVNASKCTLEKCNLSDFDWTDKISGCPVFYPSTEEFEDPLNYVRKISAEASKYGICKIVSPVKASVPASKVLRDLKFSTYVQPLRLPEWDVDDKVSFLVKEKVYTLNSFKRMADEAFLRRFPHPKDVALERLEKAFWLEMSIGQEKVEYAINVDGSAFSTDPDDPLGSSKWNLKTLPELPESVLHLVGHEIPGITYPMLYIGMLYSMFAWHVEDHYLYSMNYHHAGAPKTWYGVPGHAALQFENVALDHVYGYGILSTDDEDGAFKEIAEKTTMFPPSVLLEHEVPVYKAVQMPGEFVITFPRAYHSGFSNGFNCGEAVNFAIGNWFSFGALASKRYARIGIMAILPSEEILCKQMFLLLKQEDLDPTSAELVSNTSIKTSFLRHMRFFNNAFWKLMNNVKNIRESSMLLPTSHGTTICRTCKRDCYLVFLECNRCFHLFCHYHYIDSLDCPCGGKFLLFIRENIWHVEELVQRLEHVYGDTIASQPNGTICCINSENAIISKNVDLQWQGGGGRRKEAKSDIDRVQTVNKRYLDSRGLLPLVNFCKRARTKCKLQNSPPEEELSKSASSMKCIQMLDS